MPNALIRERVASAMVRSDPTGWNIPKPNRFAGLDTERDDVFDLEIDRVADANAVTQPVFLDLDRDPLDAEHLADQWCQSAMGPPSCPP